MCPHFRLRLFRSKTWHGVTLLQFASNQLQPCKSRCIFSSTGKRFRHGHGYPIIALAARRNRLDRLSATTPLTTLLSIINKQKTFICFICFRFGSQHTKFRGTLLHGWHIYATRLPLLERGLDWTARCALLLIEGVHILACY